MITVWITGAGGLIGNYLAATAKPSLWQIIPLTRSKLDLTDAAAVRKAFQEQRPEVIIHCAALSRSAVCEANPSLATQLNVEVTRVLAELAGEGAFFFFSTDLVFDGQVGNYNEASVPNPLSVYAKTKLEAEKIVLSNPGHTVIRTSLNGGISPTGDRSFNEELRRAWREGRTTPLFVDEFRCPIPAIVTAKAVWEMIGQKATGLYHLAGKEKLSRYEIGQLLARKHPEENPKIEAVSLKSYSGAPRPPDVSLNCDKVQKILSFPLPRMSQWIESCSKDEF